VVFTVVAGADYERGFTVGKTHQLAVCRAVAERRRLYHAVNPRVSELAGLLREKSIQVREAFPSVFAYLNGLADAAGFDMEDFILVNFGAAGFNQKEGGCTIAAFDRSPDGTVVGGNLDDPPWHFLTFEKPDSGYKALFVSLPAHYARWGGMNEHGLCMTGANGGPWLDGSPDEKSCLPSGMPSCPPVYDVLTRCRTVEEGIEMLKDNRYSPANYMLGDKNGAVQAEKRRDGTLDIFSGKDVKVLCGGNLRRKDFERHGYRGFSGSLSRAVHCRYRLARQLMAESEKDPGTEKMKYVLTHHGKSRESDAGNFGICHGGTSVSFIGVPAEKKALVAFAPPCRSGYEEYLLNSLRQGA